MIKKNPQFNENVTNQIHELRGELEKRRQIFELMDHPGWQAIKEKLALAIEESQLQRKDVLKLNETELRYQLKEEDDLQNFIDIVEKSGEFIEALEKRISELQGSINERDHSTAVTL